VDRGGKLALSRRDVDIDAKIDAIVDDFANAQIRDEIAASKEERPVDEGRGAAWLLGREPSASQAQKPRATIALAATRTWAGSARDHCIVFR
jgi:hypothetical protein